MWVQKLARLYFEPTDIDADRCLSYFKSLKKCSQEKFIHELVMIRTPEEQEQLVGEIGDRIHENVCEKAESLSSVYQDIYTLASYSIEKLIGDCDKALLAFIKHICQIQKDDTTTRYILASNISTVLSKHNISLGIFENSLYVHYYNIFYCIRLSCSYR